MTGNNPNLDLVDINAFTKFGKILSICSQDIERKRNYDRLNDGIMDGWTDGRNDRQHKSNMGPTFFKYYTNQTNVPGCVRFQEMLHPCSMPSAFYEHRHAALHTKA